MIIQIHVKIYGKYNFLFFEMPSPASLIFFHRLSPPVASIVSVSEIF